MLPCIFDDGVKRLFEQPVFFILGMVLPIGGWIQLGWPLVAFCVAVLFVRRLPWIALLSRFLSLLRARDDVLFVGWFGPIGIAALYYSLIAEHRLAEPAVFHAVSAVIVTSVVVHGVTATPGAKAFRRRGARG